MKKQFIILLTVVCALMACLFMAACSQPAASSSAVSSSSEEATEATSEAADEGEEAVEEEAGEEAEEASVSTAEYTGIPATIPSDHVGRTTDQCPTCHVEGGQAPAIPDDHFVNGQLDERRLQCITCHLTDF